MAYAPETDPVALTHALLRRGFNVLFLNPTKGLLLPAVEDDRAVDDYYRYLKKYSFRLFLRDIIRLRDGAKLKDLQRYCSEATARRYLQLLVQWSIIEKTGKQTYRIIQNSIRSFGDIFEWLVAQVLVREFCCPAVWGIRIRETGTGGDYDVLSMVEGALLYVEAKSSPPKHVDQREITAFLDRIEDLRPHFSIFLEDTHLRMKDKIAVLFKEELSRRATKSSASPLSVERLAREKYHIGDSIFIINSRPDIVANLGFCIRHFLRSKGIRLCYAYSR
jgi:hypothetical protein